MVEGDAPGRVSAVGVERWCAVVAALGVWLWGSQWASARCCWSRTPRQRRWPALDRGSRATHRRLARHHRRLTRASAPAHAVRHATGARRVRLVRRRVELAGCGLVCRLHSRVGVRRRLPGPRCPRCARLSEGDLPRRPSAPRSSSLRRDGRAARVGARLVFDPAEQGCRQCADNLVAISSNLICSTGSTAPDGTRRRWAWRSPYSQPGGGSFHAGGRRLKAPVLWPPSAPRCRSPHVHATFSTPTTCSTTRSAAACGSSRPSPSRSSRRASPRGGSSPPRSYGGRRDGRRPGPVARPGRTPRALAEGSVIRTSRYLSARRRPPRGRARHGGGRAARSGQGRDDRRRA